jgi:hydrogenase maturation protease
MSENIIIMGIGNWLSTDDGVGVHAAQALAKDPPPGAQVVDAGTDVLSALSFLEQATRVLLIDAVQCGSAPGTVRRFTERDLALPERGHTAHTVSLLASRHLLPPGAQWPEFHIIGVEPASMTYGMELSPAVAAALQQVTQLSREIVESWRTENIHP